MLGGWNADFTGLQIRGSGLCMSERPRAKYARSNSAEVRVATCAAQHIVVEPMIILAAPLHPPSSDWGLPRRWARGGSRSIKTGSWEDQRTSGGTGAEDQRTRGPGTSGPENFRRKKHRAFGSPNGRKCRTPIMNA